MLPLQECYWLKHPFSQCSCSLNIVNLFLRTTTGPFLVLRHLCAQRKKMPRAAVDCFWPIHLRGSFCQKVKNSLTTILNRCYSLLQVIRVSCSHGHKNTVLCVKWNQNGNWVLTAGKDQIIKVGEFFLTLNRYFKMVTRFFPHLVCLVLSPFPAL